MTRSQPGAPDAGRRAERRGGLRAWIAAACDADAPAPLSLRAWCLVGIFLALLLLPTLLHPLGPDQALFFVSGQKILRGEILYRDIVDIKPALIYHLYALAQILFGGGERAIRIFDLIVQGITCWLMIATIRRAGGGDLLAALAPVCYLLLYLGQGYSYTAQSEAYMGLPALLIARAFLHGRTWRSFLAIGLLVGALYLLKLTFGIMLAAVLAADLLLFRVRLRELIRHALPMIAGFGVMVGLFSIYLALGRATRDFGLISQFTSAYVAIEFRSPARWLRNLITLPALNLADNYSIAFTLATVAGIGLSLRPAPSGERERGTDFTRLLRFCAIAFTLLCVTIAIEAKYPPYHFIRLYPFGAILAAAGIVATLRLAARRIIAERYIRAILPALLAAIIFFGPFPRYVWHTLVPALQAVERIGSKDRSAAAPYSQEAFFRLGDQIGRSMKPDEKLFAMSSQAALVYLRAGVIPEFKVFHSAFVIAPFAPREWRDSTRAWLLRERPRVMVLDEGDALPGITGTDGTSIQAIRALPGVAAMIDSAYDRVPCDVPMFALYVRKNGR